MKKIPIIILLFLCLINSAEAASHREKTMDNVMNSWIGEDINNVIKIWGYPDEEKIIAEKTLYYYINYTTNQYSGVMIPYCTRIIVTDKNNIVIDGQWKSIKDSNSPLYSCPFTYRGAKKWVNPNNDYWKKQKEMKKQN